MNNDKVFNRRKARAKKMALLTQQGYTPAEISRRYKLPYATVVRDLNNIQENGVKVVWTNLGFSKVEKAKKAASLFEFGLSFTKVSKKLGVSTTTLKSLLKIAEEHGLKVDWSRAETLAEITRKNYVERRRQAAELTRQGVTQKQIAERFGITKQAVSLLLRKAAKEGNVVVLSKKKTASVSTCVICGNTFPKKRLKTCSHECKKLHLSKVLRSKSKCGGSKWSMYAFVTHTCNNCGKEFKRSNYIESIGSIKAKEGAKKYCSRNCFYQRKTWPKPKFDALH